MENLFSITVKEKNSKFVAQVILFDGTVIESSNTFESEKEAHDYAVKCMNFVAERAGMDLKVEGVN